MKMPELTQDQVMEILDKCYNESVNGLARSKNCVDLAAEYLDRYPNTEIAVKTMINNQIAMCTTSGFLTSLGGLITLPVALPANLVSVWYMQIRMIGTIAVMYGFDPLDDSVRTLVYLCLTGTSMSKICRDAGVQFGNKLTLSFVKKIPGSLLTKINQKVGFRFLTKFGTKGIINMGKAVPIVGGVISGGFDFAETKIIANRAYKMFIKGDLTALSDGDSTDTEIIQSV